MKTLCTSLLGILLLVCSASQAAAQAVETFDGTAMDTTNTSTTHRAYCSILPSATVSVYTNGVPDNSISQCPGSSLSITGNQVTARSDGYFCFRTQVPSHRRIDIKFNSSPRYRWLSNESNSSGYYNVKEFEAKGTGVDNDIKALFSAITFIACKNGGTLFFPKGDYAITNQTIQSESSVYNLPVPLPSGITLEGTNGDLYSNCRILLKTTVASLFSIGECTRRITMRNIKLDTDFSTPTTGTIGISMEGRLPPPPGVCNNCSSYEHSFTNMSIKNFEYGIFVQGQMDDPNHPDPVNASRGWEINNVKLDHINITECKVAVFLNSANADYWKITNSKLGVIADGTALKFHRVGRVTIDSTSGMGTGDGTIPPCERTGAGYSFAYISVTHIHATILIENNQSEGFTYSVYVNAPDVRVYGNENQHILWPITISNSLFGELVEFRNYEVLVSVGNTYSANNVNLYGDVTVHSIGDFFAPINRFSCPVSTPRGFVLNSERVRLLGTRSITKAANDFSDDFDIPLLNLRTPRHTEPFLRMGTGPNTYDMKRDDNGYLSFTGKQQMLFRGYKFDAPVQLRSLGLDDFPSGTPQNGAMIYCSDCQRNTAPCVKETRPGYPPGAPATMINNIWECK